MLALAARLFHGRAPGVSLATVHAGLGRYVGGGAAMAFAAALLASGISSSSVGSCAGQIIMDGFLRRRIPLTLRRLITMVPALAVLIAHVDATSVLVISQVILCFGVPFALIPLLRHTNDSTLMGEHANGRATRVGMTITIATLIALNGLLIYHTLAP